MAGDLGDIGEGVGDVATGALVARAVDPAVGGDGHTHESACLNCGAPLAGPHCHLCGQRAHVHRTLSAFFHDLLHGVLHFEGKTWRTLPLLVWRPGRLTREYIDGRRARYVSPIALFLFVVFLTFAAFNTLGQSVGLGDQVELDGTRMSLTEAEARLNRQVAEIEARRAEALAADAPVLAIDRELTGARKGLAMVQAMEQGDIGGLAAEIDAPSSAAVTSGFSLDEMWLKVRQNPDLIIYKLQSNAYKFSWLLIPISVPFLWLLFPLSRRFPLYDHTIFTTYSITFMIALVAVASLLASLGWAFGLLLLLYAPLHMYRQLRGTYGVGRWGAFWRMLALSLFAWMAIGLFVVLLGWMAAG